jgi:hypothetical protein
MADSLQAVNMDDIGLMLCKQCIEALKECIVARCSDVSGYLFNCARSIGPIAVDGMSDYLDTCATQSLAKLFYMQIEPASS